MRGKIVFSWANDVTVMNYLKYTKQKPELVQLTVTEHNCTKTFQAVYYIV